MLPRVQISNIMTLHTKVFIFSNITEVEVATGCVHYMFFCRICKKHIMNADLYNTQYLSTGSKLHSRLHVIGYVLNYIFQKCTLKELITYFTMYSRNLNLGYLNYIFPVCFFFLLSSSSCELCQLN